MNERTLQILVIGAHPDDADTECGGTAIKYLEHGHKVTYLSMTNGNAGHHSMTKERLAQRRKLETLAVAQFLGVTYEVLDIPDTELQATIENRNTLIKIIREINPDIIITHRPNDYHTDHRQTSLLVQDAAYLLVVPLVVPDTKPLEQVPLILFHQDNFTKPYTFTPHIIVNISDVIDKKIAALALHESQVFEWLPHIDKKLTEVPSNKAERIEWLKERWGNTGNVNQHIPLLKSKLNEIEYNKVTYIEAFEVSEYGSPLDEATKRFMSFGIFIN